MQVFFIWKRQTVPVFIKMVHPCWNALAYIPPSSIVTKRPLSKFDQRSTCSVVFEKKGVSHSDVLLSVFIIRSCAHKLLSKHMCSFMRIRQPLTMWLVGIIVSRSSQISMLILIGLMKHWSILLILWQPNMWTKKEKKTFQNKKSCDMFLTWHSQFKDAPNRLGELFAYTQQCIKNILVHRGKLISSLKLSFVFIYNNATWNGYFWFHYLCIVLRRRLALVVAS